jgi:site-specific DNA-methyltransferase (cytosine-N4-specific)
MSESVRDRPTNSHEYLFLLTKSGRYYYDLDAIREPIAGKPHAPENKENDGSSLVSGANISKKDAVWGADGFRNRRTVWTIPTQPFTGSHFATFPEKLLPVDVLFGHL